MNKEKTPSIIDEVLLAEAIAHGIIDSDLLRQQVEMAKRKEVLSKHLEAYSCWEDKDGYWNTYLPNECGGRKRLKKKSKDELESAVVFHYVNHEGNPEIRRLYEDWVNRRLELRKIQANTVDRYNCIFSRHFAEIAEIRIGSMRPSDFEDFLEDQIARHNLTAKGFSNLKTVCRGLLLYAKKKGYISWNVTEMFEDMDVSDRQFRKEKKESEEEVYDEAEAEKLIPYLCENPDKTNIAILLLYLTGMRVGEIVCLKKSDITGNVIRIRHTESRVTKANASANTLNPDGLIESETHFYYVKESPKSQAGNREVLIPTDFNGVLDRLMEGDSDDFLFTNENGERITTNVIRRRLEKINRKLGIRPKSPHKLRKTYASILLDHNLDNNLITSLMGHTDISMTEGHYHRDRKDQAKKSDIVSNLIEFRASTFGVRSAGHGI